MRRENWNRKQKAISTICGILEMLVGTQMGAIDNVVISLTGAVMLIIGTFYFVKGVS